MHQHHQQTSSCLLFLLSCARMGATARTCEEDVRVVEVKTLYGTSSSAGATTAVARWGAGRWSPCSLGLLHDSRAWYVCYLKESRWHPRARHVLPRSSITPSPTVDLTHTHTHEYLRVLVLLYVVRVLLAERGRESVGDVNEHFLDFLTHTTGEANSPRVLAL